MAYNEEYAGAEKVIDEQRKEIDALKLALKALTDRYTSLVNSGDCGNWNPETEAVVKEARSFEAGGKPEQVSGAREKVRVFLENAKELKGIRGNVVGCETYRLEFTGFAREALLESLTK